MYVSGGPNARKSVWITSSPTGTPRTLSVVIREFERAPDRVSFASSPILWAKFIRTPRGARWYATSVKTALARA